MAIWNKAQHAWQNWLYSKNENLNVKQEEAHLSDPLLEEEQASGQSLFSYKDSIKYALHLFDQKLSSKKNASAMSQFNKAHEEKLNSALSVTHSDLERLLKEPNLSDESKAQLEEDFKQLQRIIDKLEQKQFYMASFGRVSVGKSSLINALIGEKILSSSVLHGETKETQDIFWSLYHDQSLVFIDTPGVDEISGEARAQIARQTAQLSDLILFVVDGDLTQVEVDELVLLHQQLKPLIVVINKTDRLTKKTEEELFQSISMKLLNVAPRAKCCFVSADPRAKRVIKVDQEGKEQIEQVKPETNIEQLKQLIWEQITESGQSLQLMSSALFATQITDKIGKEIVQIRSDTANQIIRKYCIIKGLAVGLNPLPLLDLLALFGDVMLIKHLGTLYGFKLNKRESSALLKSMLGDMALILTTSYGSQVFFSTLKGVSVGLSTIFTASTQGVAAYYGTYLVGRACETYFKNGASWGEDGAKKVLESMMAQIDKQAIFKEAKIDIQRVLKVK